MSAITANLDSAGVTKLTSGGQTILVRVPDADYTVLAGETLVELTSLTATRTVTLPAPAQVPCQQVTVKDSSGLVDGSHKITLVAPALVPDTDHLIFRKDLASSGEDATMRLASVAALPTCVAAGSGVGKTLTGSAIGALSIDGTAVAATDVVLVKDQANALDDGIYVVTAAGHAATYVMDTDSISFTVSTGTATQTATRATAAVLPNTPTYSAGGKTLTAGSNTTLTVDGGVVALNDTVIVKTQASASQNGPYKCTAAGDGSNPWVLTRDTSWDTSSELTAAIGVIWTITAGTVNAGLKYALDNPQSSFVLTRKTTFDASNETLPGYLVTMSAGGTLSGTYWRLRGGVDDAASKSITTALDKMTVFSDGRRWLQLE